MATLNHEQVVQYLKHVGYGSVPSATLDVLKKLTLNHVCKVPFENLEIHYHTSHGMTMDIDALFENMVARNRVSDKLWLNLANEGVKGGYCVQLV